MTTGRINQVTIVSQKVGLSGPVRDPRDFVTDRHPLSECAEQQPQRHKAAETTPDNPPSFSQFPRASVHRTAAQGSCVAWGPQEEDSAPSFSHDGVRWTRRSPVAQW